MSGGDQRALAAELADAVLAPDPAVMSQLAARLDALAGPEWLRLDELARRQYWQPSPLDHLVWRPFLTANAALAGQVAASMCRDGRIREAAVRVLDRVPYRASGAALAVRVADWVPAVATAARAALSDRTGPHDAAVIIPVLLALGQRSRGREGGAQYLADVASGPTATLDVLSEANDRACRLWALGALAARGVLTDDVLVSRAMRDADPVVALWCGRALTDPSGELPAATGRLLLGSARAGVRAFATGHLGADDLPVHALQTLLLDRSAAVRSMARWRWHQLVGDTGPVYRMALTDPGPARQVAAALAGLDEDHDASLPEAAVPFLAHANPHVRRAAAQAVAHNSEPPLIVKHLVPLLRDTSNKVSTTALRSLRGQALPPHVVADIEAADSPRSRRIALSIRQQSGSWERVCADLAAMAGADLDLAAPARTDLLSWLRHGAATSYGRPTVAQAEQITALLATPQLTEYQRRDIAFVAGIK